MIYFLIILLISASLLEAISLSASFRNIGFEFRVQERASEPDVPFHIEQKVSNTGRFPVTFLKSRIMYPKGTVPAKDAAVITNSFERKSEERYFIFGMRSVRRVSTAVLHDRGLYWFEEAELEKGDFLGLKSDFTHTWGYSGIVIWPARITGGKTEDMLSGIVGDLLSRPFLLRDPILNAGVREYTGSEPMKTISWTQTARNSELMVRDFEYTRERSCCIVIRSDENAPDPLLDRCARIARTLGDSLMDQGVALEFFTNGYLQGTMPFKVYSASASGRSRDTFLDQLARIRTGACADSRLLLDAIARKTGRMSECILIVPEKNDGTAQFLSALNTVCRSRSIVISASETEVDE